MRRFWFWLFCVAAKRVDLPLMYWGWNSTTGTRAVLMANRDEALLDMAERVLEVEQLRRIIRETRPAEDRAQVH